MNVLAVSGEGGALAGLGLPGHWRFFGVMLALFSGLALGLAAYIGGKSAQAGRVRRILAGFAFAGGLVAAGAGRLAAFFQHFAG